MKPGPNDVLPCGTDSARRRHLAHAFICPTCEPDADREQRCPACRARVLVSGGRFVVHKERMQVSGQFQTGRRDCDGSEELAGVAG